MFASGCHFFWRNDRLKPISHPLPGVILLGAMRGIGNRNCFLVDVEPDVVRVSHDVFKN